jgi:hypothetical protein
MNDDRKPLSRDDVDKLLAPGDRVHTFKQAGPVLVGCDWDREDLLAQAERGGAELAGEQATAMKHGVVVWDGKVPTFCATANAKSEALT